MKVDGKNNSKNSPDLISFQNTTWMKEYRDKIKWILKLTKLFMS